MDSHHALSLSITRSSHLLTLHITATVTCTIHFTSSIHTLPRIPVSTTTSPDVLRMKLDRLLSSPLSSPLTVILFVLLTVFYVPCAASSVAAVHSAVVPSSPQLPSPLSAPSSAGAAACLNECSGHGSCSSSGMCECSAGYLGADCSRLSSMQPVCWTDPDSTDNGPMCAYWQLDSQHIYVRIVAVSNPTSSSGSAAGWAGLMFGAGNDGMTGGTGVYVTFNTTSQQPYVVDIYATKQSTPSVATQQTAAGVTGFANATSIDVSFQRPLAAIDSQHFTIPTASGTTTAVSVAVGDAAFGYHDWANQVSIDIAAAAAAPTTSCPNQCSAHGTCATAGSTDLCQCAAGYLGADCSLSSAMAPQCWSGAGGSMCAYWQLDSQHMYARIQAATNPAGAVNGTTASGWAGVLFGAGADGMSNGTGFYVSVDPASQQPIVTDIYATRPGRPLAATQQTAVNVTGFANTTSIDVSFQRPLAAVDNQHFAIPAAAGVMTAVSVATAPTTFSKHTWALQTEVDIAGAAAGPACPNDCSGHGACKSSVCECEDGFLALDCSVVAAFSRCPYNNDFCFSWTIVESLLYMRVRAAITPKGWAGLMFHPDTDGMSDGQLLLFRPVDGSTPAAVNEMISTGRNTPTPLNNNASQLVTAANIAAYNTADGFSDISFTRPTHPADPSLLSVETTAGVSVPMSWAIKPSSPGVLSQHGPDAGVVGMFTVDWVSGDVVIAQSKLFNYYLPVIVMLGVLLVGGISLQLPFIVHSSIGRCCLRKRVSSIGAKSYELSATHAAERTPLTYSPDDDATLVVQSDESRTITSHVGALLNWLDFATLNACSTAYHMTMGELLVVILYVACMAEFVLLARRTLQLHVVLGHITAINLTLAVLPVTRRSVWHFAFGLSFERAIKWHRFVARMAVLSMLIHALLLINLAGLSVLFHTTPLPAGIAAIYGTLAGGCMLLMSLTAFEPVRRRVFELFWYVHIPLFVSTVVFAALHSVYARYYLIGPVALYAVDWLLRFSNTARSVAVVESAVLTDAAESWRVGRLTLTAAMKPKAGQYVFLNLPAVSLLQWHPFSVSSLPEQTTDGNGSTFTVHMLDMGASTFTNAACDLISSSAYANQPIQVRLDGPFGSFSIPHTDYPTLLLVAGGIGFTPMASLLGELLSTDRVCRVFVVWTNRHSDYFYSLFPELLSQLQRDTRFSLHLFDTGSRGAARVVKSGMEDSLLARDSLQLPEEKHQHIDSLSTGSNSSFMSNGVSLGQPHLNLEVSSGRPHLPALFSRVAREHQSLEDKRRGRMAASGGVVLLGSAGVGVLCCGPSALLVDVESESMRFGFHLHKETFLL